ncbi:SpoIID/LytB domain-containing protein [Nocardioides sp. AE5]|uniref:SpoIID/LytB domain-containing protein n=1 Tax=Nocardioides sp. AE5 TaxID=2962573 RepID=UPI0028812CF3|nr:SpoIID/LytB domain-containing protein [Nocardioides sp. AE5]MDT0201926.1 SpoIID/LytB domain-containing protein [Nocardioides sp. AE5]
MRRTSLALGTAFSALLLGITGALTAASGAPVAGVVGLAASAVAADVTVNKTYNMPATGAVTLNGHGFGHGHGMSQYGAEGAARQGRTWQQILAFYYPGTTLSTATGSIRVWLTADTDRFVEVAPRSGLKVNNIDTGVTLTLPTNIGAKRWRLSSASNGVSRIEFLNSSNHWQVWRNSPGTNEFTAANSMELYIGGKPVRYRGALRSAITNPGTTARRTVNVLPLDHYLQGVVASEMPATWHANAVRSQAVAARTYAARQRQSPLTAHYDICDTTSCQVYGGVAKEHANTTAAIRATAGQVLTHDGKPAFTQYSSSNGGWTSASPNVPYMPAKSDPYDGWSGNPNHDWSIQLDVSRIEKAWPALGDLKAIQIKTRDGNGEWDGRVMTMTLQGSKGNVNVTGNTFRMTLGLKSTWFTFELASTGC